MRLRHQRPAPPRAGWRARLVALVSAGAAVACAAACSAGTPGDVPRAGSAGAATATSPGRATPAGGSAAAGNGTAASGGTAGGGATAGGGSAAGTATAGAAGAQPGDGGTSDAVVPGARCSPADLSLTLTIPGPPQGRFAVLTLTNSGPQPCRLRGFPGVDLVGPDDPVFGPRYELPRSSAPSATVELAPGGSAHAVVQFLRASPGTGHWTPTKILVTPPDTTSQLTAPWPRELALQREDAATHQTTFVGPMLPGTA